MTSRIYSDRPLNLDAVSAHVGAVAEIPQSLAGRSRRLWERLHGASAVPGEPHEAERNPQGQVGDDYSGPPFGAAHRLHVWSRQLIMGGGIYYTSPGRYGEVWRDCSSGVFEGRVYVRPHAVSPEQTAPLDQLLFIWTAHTQQATTSSWSWRIENLTLGQEVTTAGRSVVGSISSPPDAFTTSFDEPLSLVPVGPGMNRLRFTLSRTAGSGLVSIRSVSLSVTAKRRIGLTFPG